MNRLTKPFTVFVTLSVAAFAFHAIAAPDYNRIKRDIEVMAGIVRSAFDGAENCENCRVNVTGYYLAEQGVVFNVTPAGGFRYAYATDDFEHNITTFAEGMAAIPLVVEDILTEVQVNLEKEDFRFEIHSDSDDIAEATRIARQALREARAELREHNRELRELEIESIHATDQQLEELEEQREEVERQIAELEQAEELSREELQRTLDQKNSEIENWKAEVREKREARLDAIEGVVLETFCDYSTTMRNLPRGERVSLIIGRGDDDANIYVFEQSTLEDCDSAKGDIRDHALTYAF